ncbi:S1/P1 nuclease-domain-containing protein [Globomyces pollinis-pini]|nr:S1/P1 nuclease-domain-containing protein [Globomyces pollinis-pini]
MKFTLLVLSFASNSLAWSAEGHQIIGHVAQYFLNPIASAQLKDLLQGASLGDVANWADHVRPTAGNGNKHFINIQADQQGSTCKLFEETECPSNDCVIGAIATFTEQAKCGNKDADRLDAIVYLAHFFGDLAQPLHTSANEKGGNTATVIYKGVKRNMHGIWDRDMVLDRIEASSQKTLLSYVQSLINSIESGEYKAEKNTWVDSTPFDSQTSFKNSKVAVKYALDSNSFNCNEIWPMFKKNPTADLSEDFYNHFATVVDKQFAKGGFRLAAHLNALFSTSACPRSARVPVRGPMGKGCGSVNTKCQIGANPITFGKYDDGCDPCISHILNRPEFSICAKKWTKACVDAVGTVCFEQC